MIVWCKDSHREGGHEYSFILSLNDHWTYGHRDIRGLHKETERPRRTLDMAVCCVHWLTRVYSTCSRTQ